MGTTGSGGGTFLAVAGRGIRNNSNRSTIGGVPKNSKEQNIFSGSLRQIVPTVVQDNGGSTNIMDEIRQR